MQLLVNLVGILAGGVFLGIGFVDREFWYGIAGIYPYPHHHHNSSLLTHYSSLITTIITNSSTHHHHQHYHYLITNCLQLFELTFFLSTIFAASLFASYYIELYSRKSFLKQSIFDKVTRIS